MGYEYRLYNYELQNQGYKITIINSKSVDAVKHHKFNNTTEMQINKPSLANTISSANTVAAIYNYCEIKNISNNGH
ncbi:MAG: hypothetical protein COA54_11390 [Thiotrichaceae bacterium]|nr:MAG: hypothetical protein COA54_11390 [Thiotrichaceae bacterium]